MRSHIGRGVSFSPERLESMTRGGGWPNRCLIDYFDDQAKARFDKTYVIIVPILVRDTHSHLRNSTPWWTVLPPGLLDAGL